MIHNIRADALNENALNKILDYVYSKYIQEDIEPMVIESYIDMSLEEIEKKYGKSHANMVYSHIINGFGDLTKPQIVPIEPLRIIKYFDVEIINKVDKYPYQYLVYLHPNEFSAARKKILLFDVHYQCQNIEDKLLIIRAIDIINNYNDYV